MHTRTAGAVALLATGLLAGAFLYGRAVVVPTFANTPLAVHLAFRVELMKRNATVMQGLMASALVASAWFAATLRVGARATAAGAAVLALVSLLVTRLGNVPINLEIKTWVADSLPPDYPARLRTWDVFNDIRTAAALAAFAAVVLAGLLGTRSPAAGPARRARPDHEPPSPEPHLTDRPGSRGYRA